MGTQLLVIIGIGCGIGFSGVIGGILLSLFGKKFKLTKRSNNAKQALLNKEIEAIRELVIISAERNGLTSSEAYAFLKNINEVDENITKLVNKVQYAQLSKKGNISEKAESKTERFK